MVVAAAHEVHVLREVGYMRTEGSREVAGRRDRSQGTQKSTDSFILWDASAMPLGKYQLATYHFFLPVSRWDPF